MGICGQSGGICKLCEREKYTSIDAQFKNTKLLIKFNENQQIKELNSFLQCLIHIKPLVNYFKYNFDKVKKREVYLSYHKIGKCLSDSFKDLIDKSWPNGLRKVNVEDPKDTFITVNTKEFSNMLYEIEPDYNTNQKSLIKVIIMRLHEELNKVNNSKKQNIINEQNITNENISKELAFKEYKNNFLKQYQSVISDIFFGSYYTQSLCSICQTYFFIFQPYSYGLYSLNQVYLHKTQTLSLGQNELYMNNNIFCANINEINLFDCLYFDQQIKFKFQQCKSCGNYAQFNFKNIIFSSPPVLTFIFNNDLVFPDINFFIAEQINMNLFVEIKENINYNLIGIIFITFPDHYIAYCKSPIDNRWYKYDDAIVEPQNNLNEILTTNGFPYMLFYKKAETKKIKVKK